MLLETFVQSNRFAGTCYRAANWIEVGGTDGYSYFTGLKKKKTPKTIFLFPCEMISESTCASQPEHPCAGRNANLRETEDAKHSAFLDDLLQSIRLHQGRRHAKTSCFMT